MYERGSGRSEKLDDPAGYTVATMVEDVEAVRAALGLGSVAPLGHSYGGVLAQAYALKYQAHLVLCSTFHSTTKVFPESGHMTFVDQPTRFDHAVEEFLRPAAR